MAKSIFIIRSYLAPGRKSIKEISTLLVALLIELTKIDDTFAFPIFKGNQTGLTELSIASNRINSVEKIISSLILKNAKPDILVYEKEKSPTSEFSRDHGFRILFKFKSKTNSPFSLTGSLGSSSNSSLRLEYFKNNLEFSSEWYKSVFMTFIFNLHPLYAAVTPMLPDYVTMFNKLEVTNQLGWFTFFSNKYLKIEIFDVKFKVSEIDLGVVIEYLNEKLSENLESYEQARDELIQQMKLLKEQIPSYNQKRDSSLS